MKNTININALSEVLTKVLTERPEILEQVSRVKVAGKKPAADQPREMTKAERRARVSAIYRNAYLKEIANQNK